MIRIVVTGSECTGKTTLARQLAAWLKAPALPEAARIVAESVARPLTADDVGTIARRHMSLEDALIHRSHPPLVVLDTDLVSTVVYARHYYGRCERWIEDEAAARRATLYLLARPDVPWEPDGVRDRPTARTEMHAAFSDCLRKLGATVLEVDGLGPRRWQNTLAAVRGWRAAHTPQA